MQNDGGSPEMLNDGQQFNKPTGYLGKNFNPNKRNYYNQQGMMNQNKDHQMYHGPSHRVRPPGYLGNNPRPYHNRYQGGNRFNNPYIPNQPGPRMQTYQRNPNGVNDESSTASIPSSDENSASPFEPYDSNVNGMYQTNSPSQQLYHQMPPPRPQQYMVDVGGK